MAAALEALNIIETEPQARKELAEKSVWAKKQAYRKRFNVPKG